ncbi:MAG: cell division protein FtsL [Burkholderiales bacterium]
MTKFNAILLLTVILSALFLVRNQYESRRLFAELDKVRAGSRQLEIDHDRLLVQRQAQATPLRVEKLAKDQLQMRSVTPAITQYVTYPAGALAPSTPAVGVRP